MIHKLRRKFIFINMTIVTLLLAGVLGAVWFSSYRHLETEIENTLEHALDGIPKEEFPKLEPPEGISEYRRLAPLMTAFAVDVFSDGSYELVYENGTEASSEMIERAISAVEKSGQPDGTLHRLSLRYRTRETGDSMRIAFLDTSQGASSLKRLALTCILVLAAGLLALSAISYFLSRWALRPVEDAWNQQNQFIADASHELKTPLTVILANLKILLAHPSDTICSQERWIKNTQSEAESMKKLVEELLFLARSDANTVSSEKTACNLSDLAVNTLLLFEPVAYEQGVRLEQAVAPDLMVSADREQMKRLLAILLDNACKYAGADKRVTLTLSRQKEKARLSVANTGSRIPEEELSHLFERFYRADKSRARTKDGYGLGLSIAQAIVQGHGGKITAESTENQTCFTVFLPL